MADKQYKLNFRGVRGSRCVSAANVARYGGHTTCVDVQLSPTRWLIIDCGLGLCSLSSELRSKIPLEGFDFDVLMTHYHLDHLIGLSYFEPLYNPSCRFTFRGFPWGEMGVQETLERLLGPPWFPVPLGKTASSKTYVDLTGEPFEIDGLSIRTARVKHPQGATAYRLEHAGGSLVFATDTEHGDAGCEELLSLTHRSDVLIHDAQYTPEEFEGFRGRGHSTWQHAVEVARRAEAAQLILFHHDPERTDEELDRIVEAAGKEFPGAQAAREGMSISF